MIRVATCAECMQADVPKWRDEGGGEFCLDHAYAHVWVLVEKGKAQALPTLVNDGSVVSRASVLARQDPRPDDGRRV